MKKVPEKTLLEALSCAKDKLETLNTMLKIEMLDVPQEMELLEIESTGDKEDNFV